MSDRDILEQRARALARPPVAAPTGERLELLTFLLAGEVYALQSRYVSAVFPLAALALLPGAAPPLLGITAWRGELLTILDLRVPLGLSSTALNDLRHVLVLGEERAAFGILADSALGIVSLAASDVRAPGLGVAARREFLRGITDEAVLVLDALKLFHVVGASLS